MTVQPCRRWHNEQRKQGSSVYLHSSLVQEPVVCCQHVIFPPCAKVFMQWRNLGRSVILLSHQYKSERQIFFFYLFFLFFSFFAGSKEAGDCKGRNCNTTFMCSYISPPSEQQDTLSPIETLWQIQTHNVEKMLYCVLFNWQVQLADQPL